MGKKEKKPNSDVYEKEQTNKRHRKKSKKLEKRENLRKNKKKTKKERNQKRKMLKYVKKVFKENNEQIDTTRLFEHCLDIDEMAKQVRKLLTLNKEAVNEIPELFKTMEEGKKEVNLAGMEDKQVQKYLLKLMKNLKIDQNSRNPYSFKITNLKRKIDSKMRYTSDTNDLIPECLTSYYFLVKGLFEYENYVMNSKEDDNEEDNSEVDQSENDEEEEEKSELNEKISSRKLKELEREKYEMDCEYELFEEKLGKNAELINKAFNKIMQEDSNKKPEEGIQPDEEEELVGPPVPKFLENTLNLLNSNIDYNEDEKDSFNSLINKTSFTNKNNLNKNSKLITTVSKSKIEPINKESYDRQIAYEKERVKFLSEHLEDYESNYRKTSLLEEHQNKNKKFKGNQKDDMMSTFDRERDMDIGRIDSKRALAIMRDSKGLQGRFEAKEKYVGY